MTMCILCSVLNRRELCGLYLPTPKINPLCDSGKRASHGCNLNSRMGKNKVSMTHAGTKRMPKVKLFNHLVLADKWMGWDVGVLRSPSMHPVSDGITTWRI